MVICNYCVPINYKAMCLLSLGARWFRQLVHYRYFNRTTYKIIPVESKNSPLLAIVHLKSDINKFFALNSFTRASFQ